MAEGLLGLSEDCLLGVMMHCEAQQLVSLRATCTLLCRASREPAFLRRWRAAHASERKAYLEMRRLASHYDSLDESSLEVEPATSNRLPPPPVGIPSSHPLPTQLGATVPAADDDGARAREEAAASCTRLNPPESTATATVPTTSRAVLREQLQQQRIRQPGRAHKAARHPLALGAAALEAQRLYFEQVDEWVLEIEH